MIDHRREALNMVNDPEGADYNPQEALVHAILHLAEQVQNSASSNEALERQISSLVYSIQTR